MRVFCGKDGSNNGVLTPITEWGTCAQLPCKCLGKDNGLSVDQSLRVLETSCPSNDSYTAHTDKLGKGFIVPKRINCGTYKPLSPTWQSRCECTEKGTRKLLIKRSQKQKK